MMIDFYEHFPQLKVELEETRSFILTQVTLRNKEIELALNDMILSGGKLLRPAFFYLFSSLGNKEKQEADQLLKIAASLELLHMATLIHDDIIDDSPLRRGTATVQSQYGKDIAVYTGDLLFTVYFDLIAETMENSGFLHKNARAMKRLLLGELDQMKLRYNPNNTVKEYLCSVDGKTAELFALSCLEGAYFGFSSEQTQQLAERIGRNIGIAFQINDDILDYTSNSSALKKPVLEDLCQGIYTLPLLLAMEQAPEIFLPFMNKKQTITIQESAVVAELVKEYHGVEAAFHIATNYTNKALQDIRQLPESVEKQQLLHLTRNLLNRNN